MRRSSRRRPSPDSNNRNREHSMSDNEKAEANEETPLRNTRSKDRKNEKTQEEQNHSGWVRRSSRRTKSFSPHAPEIEACHSDATHNSVDTGVRRSKREHHKPSFYDPVAYEKRQSSSDDEDEDGDEEEDDDEEVDEDEEGIKLIATELKLHCNIEYIKV